MSIQLVKIKRSRDLAQIYQSQTSTVTVNKRINFDIDLIYSMLAITD